MSKVDKGLSPSLISLVHASITCVFLLFTPPHSVFAVVDLQSCGALDVYVSSTNGLSAATTASQRCCPAGRMPRSMAAEWNECSVPVTLPSNSLAREHACVESRGAVFCWGRRVEGEQGDGQVSVTPQSTPTMLSDFDGKFPHTTAISIALGWEHTCVTTAEHRIKCWGRNIEKQLGDGTSVARRATPSFVAEITASQSHTSSSFIVSGFYHTCSLQMSGHVVCFGLNDKGQLGSGNFNALSGVSAVVDINGQSPETSITQLVSGGWHNCVLLKSKRVKCWGSNQYQQLGNGGSINAHQASPTELSVLDANSTSTTVATLACGGRHTCAITELGALYCWGSNEAGQLGLGSTSQAMYSVPTAVPALDGTTDSSRVLSMNLGYDHVLVLTAAHTVLCFGQNLSGQCGIGSAGGIVSTPTPVIGLEGLSLASSATVIQASGSSSCATKMDGQLLCWGHNLQFNLGDGTNVARSTPTSISTAAFTGPL